MGIGSNIKKILSARKISIKQLSELTGIPINTLYSITKNDNKNARSDTLQKIAEALHLDIKELMNTNDESICTSYIDQKLSHIGYKLNGDESEGYLWIEYPDGTLEVTEQDIEELDQSSNSYLKFKLEELKEKNIKDFKRK